jgi:chromate reductase
MDDGAVVLAICGSLRAASLNRALLDAVIGLAPELEFVGADLVPDLPLFNPDAESFSLPVQRFREAAARAHGVVIASPEYAFAPSGVTKNALDWLVGSSGLMSKPTLMMSASPGHTGGFRGLAGLIPTLDVMGAVMLDPVTVSRAGARIRPGGEVVDDALRQRLNLAVTELRRALDYSRGVEQVREASA